VFLLLPESQTSRKWLIDQTRHHLPPMISHVAKACRYSIHYLSGPYQDIRHCFSFLSIHFSYNRIRLHQVAQSYSFPMLSVGFVCQGPPRNHYNENQVTLSILGFSHVSPKQSLFSNHSCLHHMNSLDHHKDLAIIANEHS